MEFTVEQARAQFEQLVERAEAGEEVIIVYEGGRSARLERIADSAESSQNSNSE